MTESDEEYLKKINCEIGTHEEKGEWEALRDLLATQETRAGDVRVLAFRRAGGACVDARAFIDRVEESDPRTTSIVSITPEGDHVAIVRCVVETGGSKYDNFRVFVRRTAKSDDWRLLAWANQPHPPEEPSAAQS